LKKLKRLRDSSEVRVRCTMSRSRPLAFDCAPALRFGRKIIACDCLAATLA